MLTHLSLIEKLHRSLLSEAPKPPSPWLAASHYLCSAVQSTRMATFPVSSSFDFARASSTSIAPSRSGEPSGAASPPALTRPSTPLKKKAQTDHDRPMFHPTARIDPVL